MTDLAERTAQPVLEVKGLRKRFKQVQALDGVDLTIGRGQVFGFLGPNGAGKTTFTKCITGFIHRDGGTVTTCGIDPEHDPASAGARVGLVPDQYDFYPWMTGRQHLEFYASLQGIPKKHREKRIRTILERVGMTDRADEKTKAYSHGMKQRICIAQAILHRPDFVILDEPTNGLDPKGAYELRRLIRNIAADGVAVLLNSHLMHEVEEVCDHVAIIDKGRLLASGAVSDLLRDFSRGDDRVRVRLRSLSEQILAATKAVGSDVKVIGKDTVEASVPESRMSQLLEGLIRAGGQIVDIDRQETRLEELFLHLTEESS